jgi:hypothetical protein
MNILYPIVQRVRRSLIVAESVPEGPPKPVVGTGNVEAVQPVAARGEVAAVVPVEPVKTSDEKVSDKKNRP